MATTAWVRRSRRRHSATNWLHTALIAEPLSRRKSAIVLNSGVKPTGQPHHLEIAARFAFQPPARLNLVQRTVEVNLEQRRRVIRGAAGRLRYDACQTQ